MNIRTLMLIVATLLLSSNARADQPPMVFDHLTLEHGLSQATVMDIHQDSQGFMWLATENGLNRWDGYEFTLYSRERGNPNGLGSDYVWAIDEDTDGNLWFATEGGGVAVWNRKTDRFSSHRHDPDDAQTLSSDSIRNLLVDRSKRVWVATRNNGLNLLDVASGTVTRFSHDANDENSISSSNLFALLEDHDGNIWIGTTKVSIDSAQKTGRSSVMIGSTVSTIRVSCHSHKTVVVTSGSGTFGRAHRLNPETQRITAYRHDENDPGSISSDDVRTIYEDAEKRLWIGTGRGLNLFDRIDGRFQRYQRDGGNPQSLKDDSVMVIYQDQGGLLWVGTRFGGASRWNPRSWSFGHYYRDWLDGAYVMSFADDEQGDLWIGTLGSGLSRLNLSTGARSPIDEVASNPTALADARIMSLLYDRVGQLWIGTMSGGLSRLGTDNVIETFRSDSDDDATIAADGIMSLYEDSFGGVWIGTFGGGVNYYDQETRRFQRTFGDSEADKALGSFRVTALVEVRQWLYLGSDGWRWAGAA